MIQAVAVLSVFGLGMCFAILGALKLKLTQQLEIDDARFGNLISTLMFTSLIIILIMGPIVDMVGYMPIAILGFIVTFVAVLMLVYAKSYATALIAAAILGFGAMSLNLGNTLLPMVIYTDNPSAAANFGNVFFGIGAFITPLIAGALLARVGLKGTGWVLGIILLIPVIFAIFATYPQVPGGFEVGKALALLANPAIILAALALFCYIGLESSMGGFITTYLSDIGFGDSAANYLLSGFWIGLMASRLIISQLIAGDVIPAGNDAVIVAVLGIVAVISILIMISAKSKALGGLFVVIAGLSFGPLFPTVVGYTFNHTSPEVYGSAFGIIFAVGLLGGTTIPSAIGSMAKGKSIQKSLFIDMIAAIVLVAIAIIMRVVG